MKFYVLPGWRLLAVLVALLVCSPLPAAQGRVRSATAVSDPAAALTLAGGIGGRVNVVALSGTTAYIGEGAGLLALDVSQPAAPALLSRLAVGHVVGLEVSGTTVAVLLYLAEEATGEDVPLEIVDVRDPDKPVFVGLLPASGPLLTLQGDNLYLLGRHLSVVDVHTPAQPQLRGRQIASGSSLGQIEVVDGLAFLASNYGGLRVYDVRNPNGLLLRASAPLMPWAVHVEGGRVYVVDENDGLLVLDLHTDRFRSPIYLPMLVR